MGDNRAACNATRPAADAQGSDSRAVAAAVAIAALPVLSGTMLAVALPDVASNLRARPGAVVSIVTVYVVVLALAQPVAGACADRAGLGRCVRAGLVVLASGSLLAMLSWTLAALLVARGVQALGAALVVPGIVARLVRSPGRDARRFGLLTAVANVVAAVGPVVGAVVVAHVGWRGVFAITIVLAAVAAVVVPGDGAHRVGPAVSSGTVGNSVGLLVRDRRVAAAAALNLLDNVVLHTLLLGLPFALMAAGGMAAATALATLAIAAAAAAPVGGHIADRAGHGATVRAGFLVAAVGMLILAVTGPASGLPTVVGIVIAGTGLGLEFPSLQAAPLRLVPADRHAAAAGLMASARQAGCAGGASLAAVFAVADPAALVGVGALVAVTALPLVGVLDPSTPTVQVRPTRLGLMRAVRLAWPAPTRLPFRPYRSATSVAAARTAPSPVGPASRPAPQLVDRLLGGRPPCPLAAQAAPRPRPQVRGHGTVLRSPITSSGFASELHRSPTRDDPRLIHMLWADVTNGPLVGDPWYAKEHDQFVEATHPAGSHSTSTSSPTIVASLPSTCTSTPSACWMTRHTRRCASTGRPSTCDLTTSTGPRGSRGRPDPVTEAPGTSRERYRNACAAPAAASWSGHDPITAWAVGEDVEMTIEAAARDGGTTTLDDQALAEFAMSFHGDILTPGDAGYDDARVTYNAMIDRRPAAILRCTGTADVVDAVNLVREHGLLASVRGGGHSVAGLSVHDDAVMIDLSRMRGVHVDPKRQRARVQAGAELGDVDRETQLYGLATPAGVISTTGVAGLTLGGGIGWLRRKYGLTCDNLLSAEIVTADGQLQVADENQHPDLFWALRGGGGNFGVVASFEFRLHPVGPLVYAALPMYPAEDASQVLRGWRQFVADAPDEITAAAIVITMPPDPSLPEPLHGRAVVVTGALYAGPPDEGEQALKPLRELGTPLADLSSVMPYRGLQSSFDPFFPRGQWRSYWKSTYLAELPDQAIDLVAERALERPGPFTVFNLQHLGGVMSRIAPNETAFAQRTAPFLLSVDGTWADAAHDDNAIAFVRHLWDDLQPFGTGGTAYLEMLGAVDESDQLVRATHGDNLHRLAATKATYDPDNVFRLNRNIAPA